MSVSDAKRLKELETENHRLKKLLAESLLENEGDPTGNAGRASEARPHKRMRLTTAPRDRLAVRLRGQRRQVPVARPARASGAAPRPLR
jgi:hypothetical protein